MSNNFEYEKSRLALHFSSEEVSSPCKRLRWCGDDVATDSELLLKSWCERRDPETRRELIERHLPLVNALVRPFAGRGEQLDDLAQIGAIGLIKAVDRFDPRRGDSLAAYAIPTSGARSGATSGTARNRSDFHARDESSGRTWPAVRCAHRRRRPASDRGRARSGYGPIHRRGGRGADADPPRPPRRYAATARDRAAERRLELGEERVLIESGLRTLGRRERRIVRLRYYGGLSQRGIAAEVGLSQVHVSRLLRESLKKLRHEIGQDSGRQ